MMAAGVPATTAGSRPAKMRGSHSCGIHEDRAGNERRDQAVTIVSPRPLPRQIASSSSYVQAGIVTP